MLHRLCGPPSIPLSFSLATVLPRRYTYRVSLDTEGANSPDIECTTFTAKTTRVSNPFRYPSLRTSASGIVQRLAFATGVPPDIYAFHCYTRNSRLPSTPLVRQFPAHFPGWARSFHAKLASPPTHALRPVNPNNAWDLRITAAAGTELAVPSFDANI